MSKKNLGPKCGFTNVWDDGSQITTACDYDPVTGEVTPQMSKAIPKGSCVREYITLYPSGEEIDVCRTCHEYILRTELEEGIGRQLLEVKHCTNPDCPSREML